MAHRDSWITNQRQPVFPTIFKGDPWVQDGHGFWGGLQAPG